MGRLIDADEYEKRIKPYDTEDVMDKALYNFAHTKLLSTPTARPKGKWIDITKCGGASLWKCSECGELFLEDFYYCPNCGADMREVE